MTQPRKLVMRESEWMTAANNGGGTMYKNGRYCCLGLLSRECGVDPKDYPGLSKAYPATLFKALAERGTAPLAPLPAAGTEWTIGQYGSVSVDAQSAVYINDAKTPQAPYGPLGADAYRPRSCDAVPNSDRVEMLRPIFARNGWELDYRPNE